MPKGIPAKKEQKDWKTLPGEKVTPFTLPEQTIADHEAKFEALTGVKNQAELDAVRAVPGTWTEKTFTAQVDRDELERLLGGEFEDVAGEPSRRSNHKFETYSDGVDCYCYQCPRGSKPPVVAHTWADVATRMGV